MRAILNKFKSVVSPRILFVSNDKQIYLFPAHTLRVAPIKIIDENLYPLKTILIFPLSLFSACAMFRIKINLHIKSCDRGAV